MNVKSSLIYNAKNNSNIHPLMDKKNKRGPTHIMEYYLVIKRKN